MAVHRSKVKLLKTHSLPAGLSGTVEPDLIATEILAFPSKPSRNKNHSDLMIAIP